MCIFGHKFGVVHVDGFQYCSKCGEARRPSIPHPCVNGHIWRDDKMENYTETSYGTYGTRQERSRRQTFQTCTRCGEKRNIWG